jgi:hypothetical protein
MHLWKRVDTQEGWVSVDVAPEGVAFVEGGVEAGAGRERALALVVPFDENGVERAALLMSPSAGSTIRVNGSRPLGGLCVLRDRDEISIDGRVYYVTRRTTLDPAPLPAGVGSTQCSRCSDLIGPGDMAVRCPACAGWHHEGARSDGEPRSCWTYDAECVCGVEHEGLVWRPGEDLHA